MRAVTTVLKKLVVRNIPPSASEREVHDVLRAHGVDLEFVWRFVPGRQRSNKRASTPGRLYLDMKKAPEKATKIIAALHGQPFACDAVEKKDVDAKPLDVEFAPFQRIAREKQRSDAKTGTIGRDPDYVAFLEELSRPKDKLPSAEAVVDMAEGETVEKPVAALVKYLNERKTHSREKGKGKPGGKPLEKSERRQKGKKEVARKKPTDDKLKASKDRQKKSSSDTAGTQDPKNRKQRGKASPKKGPAKQESIAAEPGTLRVMASKSGAAAVDAAFAPANTASGRALSGIAPTECRTEKRAPKSGKKNGGRGRSNVKKPVDGVNVATGEGTSLKPPLRLKGKIGSKKEPGSKGERKKKVFAPKDSTTQGTPSKS